MCNVCVVCKSVSIYQYLVTCGMLHWSSHWTNIWATNLLGSIIFFIVIFNRQINTFVYNFNDCCQSETRRGLLVQSHFCFERKRGYNSTANHVLKIYWQCIEYTRFPRDHFKPMIYLVVWKKSDICINTKHVTHCFTFLFLYVFSSVLWCLLRFLHKKHGRFVFTSSCV
jgi:hypothetical protein